ncbi:hypothetical protein ACS127_02145 [Amphibacillus sp. Q70]|uniref:hypothetical protein n=1 Tax=Amphibacillus sp. Q70 TaxID=3453416 RepID=UPI003F85545C
MTFPSPYAAYRYVKVNRRKKKRHLNRLAFQILFDKTSLIYLGVFCLLFAFWFSDQLIMYTPIFESIEQHLWANYFGIILFSVIRPLSLASTRPGVLFSSSDLFLTLLPYDQKKLWQYHALDKVKKLIFIYLFIGIALKIVTPFSISLIVVYIVSFWLGEVLMIIPQWLIYQKRWYIKWLIIQGLVILNIGLNILSLWIDLTSISFILIIVSLVIMNQLGYRRLFKWTDWSTIVEVNDRLLTKNMLISFASNVKVQPPKPQGFYHNIIRNKRLRKPFDDQKRYQIYDRLIFITFTEQKEHVIKAVLGCIGIIFILGFQSEVTYSWAIIIVIFLYGQIGTSFYPEIFEEKLIFALPWRINHWQKAFSRWLFIGLLLLMIGLAIPSLYWFESLLLSLLNWISHVLIGYTFYCDQLNHRTRQLIGETIRFPIFIWLTFFVLFFGVIYSIQYPIVNIMIIIYTGIRYTYDHIVS